MIETKVMEVGDSNLQDVINEMQWFGWQVLSTQKIDYNTASRATGSYDKREGYKFTVYNNNTCYYSVTFQRDTNLPHYERLDELHSQYLLAIDDYNKVVQSKPQSPAKTVFFILAMVSLPTGSLMSLIFLFTWIASSFKPSYIASVVISLFYLLTGIIFLRISIKKGKALNILMKDYRKKEANAKEIMLEKIKNILDEAKSYTMGFKPSESR